MESTNENRQRREPKYPRRGRHNASTRRRMMATVRPQRVNECWNSFLKVRWAIAIYIWRMGGVLTCTSCSRSDSTFLLPHVFSVSKRNNHMITTHLHRLWLICTETGALYERRPRHGVGREHSFLQHTLWSTTPLIPEWLSTPPPRTTPLPRVTGMQ